MPMQIQLSVSFRGGMVHSRCVPAGPSPCVCQRVRRASAPLARFGGCCQTAAEDDEAYAPISPVGGEELMHPAFERQVRGESVIALAGTVQVLIDNI